MIEQSLRLGLADVRRMNPDWTDAMILDYVGRQEDLNGVGAIAEKNSTDIASNSAEIDLNTAAIAQNATDIAANALAIQINSQNITINANTLVTKGAGCKIVGGAITESYNVSGLTPLGVGSYQIDLIQDTAGGVDIATEGFVTASSYFSSALRLFDVRVRGSGPGAIIVNVFEVTTPGGALTLTPYALGGFDEVCVSAVVMDGSMGPP